MKLNLAPESDLTRPEMENIKLRLHRVETKEISTVTLGAIANSLLTTRGDIIVRNATVPDRLALTVPASPIINVLGVANGETQPTWKSASSAPGAAAAILATDANGYTKIKKLISGTNSATSGSILVQADYDGNPAQIMLTEYSTGGIGFSLVMYQDGSADWRSSFAYGAIQRSAVILSADYLRLIAAPSQDVAVGDVLTTQPATVFSVTSTGNVGLIGYIEMAEMSAPAAGAANTARTFCRDNGSGKSQLCVIFNSGAIQVVATEP